MSWCWYPKVISRNNRETWAPLDWRLWLSSSPRPWSRSSGGCRGRSTRVGCSRTRTVVVVLVTLVFVLTAARILEVIAVLVFLVLVRGASCVVDRRPRWCHRWSAGLMAIISHLPIQALRGQVHPLGVRELGAPEEEAAWDVRMAVTAACWAMAAAWWRVLDSAHIWGHKQGILLYPLTVILCDETVTFVRALYRLKVNWR